MNNILFEMEFRMKILRCCTKENHRQQGPNILKIAIMQSRLQSDPYNENAWSPVYPQNESPKASRQVYIYNILVVTHASSNGSFHSET